MQYHTYNALGLLLRGKTNTGYKDMRLSGAGAAKDAQVRSGILLSDLTRNLVVIGRLPYRVPNFASYVSSGRPHHLALAHPHAA